MKTFKEMNLGSKAQKLIELNHFKKPTPIQEKVIPAALRGKDIIGVSSTGTGKTHAYLIPLMEKIDSSQNHVQAVISAPTRELAVQIFEKASLMSQADPDLKIRLVIGGRDRQKEISALQKEQPHLVVGTPGRLKDLFLTAGVLRLDKAGILVVDEADMTLEYGFLNDVDAFAGRMKDSLQMLAFSATVPDQLKPFLKKYMHHPLTIRIDEKTEYNPKIHHILVPCRNNSYARTILSILPGFQPYVCLIFTNTRAEAKTIADELRAAHLSVSELHGDMESRKRRQAMKEIESAQKTYVVATDLAARGIDMDTVSHVISCGFPDDLAYYIHRAGRTARAGAEGVCYALYHDEDNASIRSLQKQGIRFDHMRYGSEGWKTLRPYGERRRRPDDEMDKKISMMMTKKNTKVKPGYKKKRAKAIEKLQKDKRRDYIRGKIKEEKKARYRKTQSEKTRSEQS